MHENLKEGFRLGELLVQPFRGRIIDRDESRHLSPKAAEVLLCLAGRPNEIVSRADLLASGWGEGRGSQEALSHAISALRTALDDHRAHPRFIQTVPGRGYRLLVEPEPIGDADPPRDPSAPRPNDFLGELKRRGVIETGLANRRRIHLAVTAMDVETRLRDDLYRHLQRLDVGFHDRWQSGQLLSRATSDIATIRRFSAFGAIFLLIISLEVVAIFVLLLTLYWPLALLAAAFAVPVLVLCARFEREYTQMVRRIQDETGDMTTEIEEAAKGIGVIKAFGRARYAFDRYDAHVQRLHRSQMARIAVHTKFVWLLGIVPNLILVATLLAGVLAVGSGALTLGGLFAFVSYVLILVFPLEALGWILAMAQEAMTAAARILEIFDTEPAITSGTLELDRPRGHLRLEHVDFAFPDADHPDGPPALVLRDVNLEVAPGETVAIVGATGSGKTTLTALVPRLYDVTGGRVTIDGVDVRDLTLPSLRRVVATAFEEPTLFSMSARENLTLGRSDATEEEVLDAIEVAQAGFVHDLPWGLDTRIGEQGMSLSGGQRQRLALARAVLARPKILVLDDTLSALDVHTEKLVEAALRRVLENATGIVVAHRASTVLLADKVALLQNGTITHVGDHSELLATVPAYRELLAADVNEEVSA